MMRIAPYVRRPVSSSPRRWPALTVAALAAVTLAIGASRPAPRSTSHSEEPVITVVQATAPADVDILGIWINAARETIQRVRDYQCTFIKRERYDGVLQDEQTAVLKVRHQPFSVHLKFVAPRASAGKEAVYVAGRNNGKMRAKTTGALSLVGFVSLDTRDPRAMQGTRHDITEAGISHLLERIVQARTQFEGHSSGHVSVGEVMFHQRACVRIEIIDPNADGKEYTHRSVIYFDKDTNLPVRYEAYGRPRPGVAGGDLLECYSYIDCRFNMNLGDAAFNY